MSADPLPDSTVPLWLSVIIPVYNDGSIALNAVRAIHDCETDELLKGVEVLCVEGGSEDDSPELIDAFCREHARVRLIRCPSGAVAPKFNLGAHEANGEWLAFTESDCIPDKGWIRAWKEIADAGDWQVSAGRVRAYSDDPNLQLSIRDSSKRKTIQPSFYNKAVSFYHGQGNNFLIRRDLFLEVGGVDERLGVGAPGRSGQDSELNFRLLRRGIPIGFEPDALVVHYPKETRESFLHKKRNYYYAGVWWIVVIHPTSLACLFGLFMRAFYPLFAMLVAMITFKWARVRQGWEEWKGFFGGLWAGLKYKLLPPSETDNC